MMERYLLRGLTCVGALMTISASLFFNSLIHETATSSIARAYDIATADCILALMLIFSVYAVGMFAVYGRSQLEVMTTPKGSWYAYVFLMLSTGVAIEALQAIALGAYGAGIVTAFVAIILCLGAAWGAWGARCGTGSPWKQRLYWRVAGTLLLTPITAVFVLPFLPGLPAKLSPAMTVVQALPFIATLLIFMMQLMSALLLDYQLPVHQEEAEPKLRWPRAA